MRSRALVCACRLLVGGFDLECRIFRKLRYFRKRGRFYRILDGEHA